ncbi:HYD1 signature containing ADP-ribosyltransferase family protein [Cytobacillus horneckiae]|uniref:HYD1 signature containing ADP-ribosyltransferase family protein n=1 Tax=Cytobacillus horneckiae TaxID=549687 RepID=UPI003D9A9950
MVSIYLTLHQTQKTPAQLAKQFINVPNKYKYTHYLEKYVSGLEVIKGRDGVFVIPNETALDLTGRIVRSGKVGGK